MLRKTREGTSTTGRGAGILLALLMIFAISAPAAHSAQSPPETGELITKMGAYWGASHLVCKHNCPLNTQTSLLTEVEAKAQPDECFAGVGNPYPPGPPCPTGSQPKVNEAYIWGMTKQGDNIWFGTVANTHCLVMAGYLDMDASVVTDNYVCELGDALSPYGDFRRPKIYWFKTQTGELLNMSPMPPSPAGMLLASTSGLRSAGSINGIAFLAGPGGGGIRMFAFDANTGVLLGAKHFDKYNDIRQWVMHDGKLYTGVGLTQPNPDGGGAVLRWIGSYSTDPNVLFNFQEVGHLPAPASNIAYHEGRLFVGSWPGISLGVASEFSLTMSPPIPSGGLTDSHQKGWTKVWGINEFEPDALVAGTTGGGALASFKGHLYWGTMHVPFLAMRVATESHANNIINLDRNNNSQLDEDELLLTALGTHRSIAIFRGRDFGTPDQEVDLLYGDKYLPRYDADLKAYTIAADSFHMNKLTRPTPVWGPAGFGNFFNSYTWTMKVFNDQLYIGTFDYSVLFDNTPEAQSMRSSIAKSIPESQFDIEEFRQLLAPYVPIIGADLYRIMRSDGRARPESLDGVGNPMNYGIRTIVTDEMNMYLGTANPMNLSPDGGWELIQTESSCFAPTLQAD